MNRLFSGRSDMPFALLLLAQLITAGWSGGLANGVEYRNQFFTSAAQSQHRVNLCWGE